MHKNHEKYMQLALAEAQKALAKGEFPVGCVFVAENRVLAAGSRLNSREKSNELDHAEIVVLRQCLIEYPDLDLSTVTVYSTMEPCLMCTATLIVNKVQSIVYGFEDAMGGGTNLPLSMLSPLYASHPLQVIHGVMRRECLRLFYQFFANPNHQYLRNTLLAWHSISEGEKELFHL